MSSPTVGRTPFVAPTRARRGRAEPRAGELPGAVGVATVASGQHGQAVGHAGAGAGVRVVEPHRVTGPGAGTR